MRVAHVRTDAPLQQPSLCPCSPSTCGILCALLAGLPTQTSGNNGGGRAGQWDRMPQGNAGPAQVTSTPLSVARAAVLVDGSSPRGGCESAAGGAPRQAGVPASPHSRVRDPAEVGHAMRSPRTSCVQLYHKMEDASRANLPRGAPRIVGERRTLGMDVVTSTGEQYRVRPGKPPSPTWKTLVKNSLQEMIALEIFVVPL